MVKNNSGGNKAKGYARKNLVKRDGALRTASEHGEIYAQAVKVLGGNIASAIDLDGNPLRAHIRGKFRGRGKRDNFIAPGTWLLVGLHSWEEDKTTSKPGEIKNCDVLEVYTDADKSRLKNSVSSVNWSVFISNDTKMISSRSGEKDDDNIEFVSETAQEYQDIIEAQASSSAVHTIIMDNDERIDVDDI